MDCGLRRQRFFRAISSKKVEIHIFLLLLLLNHLRFRLSRSIARCCCGGTSTSSTTCTTTSSSSKAFQFFFALSDDLMHRLALKLRDKFACYLCIIFTVYGFQDLLDVRCLRTVIASQDRHQVCCDVFETHCENPSFQLCLAKPKLISEL